MDWRLDHRQVAANDVVIAAAQKRGKQATVRKGLKAWILDLRIARNDSHVRRGMP